MNDRLEPPTPAQPDPAQPIDDAGRATPQRALDSGGGLGWVGFAAAGGVGGLTVMLGLLAARQPDAAPIWLFLLVACVAVGAAVAAPAVAGVAQGQWTGSSAWLQVSVGGAAAVLGFVIAFFLPIAADDVPEAQLTSNSTAPTTPATSSGTAPGDEASEPTPETSTTATTTTTTTQPPDPRESLHQVAMERAAATVEELVRAGDIETLVGQLFVANFPGPDPLQFGDLEYAQELFRRGRVGGLFLTSTNCNFNNGVAANSGEFRERSCAGSFGYEADVDTVGDAASMTNAFQTMAFDISQELGSPYLPLFIAVDHEGDGKPRTHLVNGFHAIPSQMAIGATWNADDAYDVGRAVGSDLAGVGVNLLLGPVADVMKEPKPSPTDIGIRTFGSSPALVSEMAASYIAGVGDGSSRSDEEAPRVLTVVKHFPGHGASNEDPDNNLSEVLSPRSVVDLDESALSPFGRLASEAFSRRPGGFMSSHLVYPNIEECGQDAVYTFSGDCVGAFTAHMSSTYPGFESWRAESILITDALGVRGLRETSASFFENEETLCELAAQAVQAGHDLLLLGRWSPAEAESEQSTRWSRELESVVFAVECLASRYRADEAYTAADGSPARLRERLEEAAERVLKAKYLLYPALAGRSGEEALAAATASPDRSGEPGGAYRADVDDVARSAVTVISQRSAGAWDGIQNPSTKSIVFVECWDERAVVCGGDGDALWPGRLEGLAVSELGRTFGATRSVDLLAAWCVSARDHDREFRVMYDGDVEECDGAPEDASDDIRGAAQALSRADVVVFGVSAPDPDSDLMFAVEDITSPASLLAAGATKVMVATNRPYYENRTALSQIDLYLGTYSKIEASLVGALRVAVLGVPAEGTLPVHYPDVFGRLDFEQQEAEWLSGQRES